MASNKPPTSRLSGEEPQDGPAYYGEEVRHARDHARLTQDQMAEKISYKKPYISKVENGVQLGSELFAKECDKLFNTSGYFQRLRYRVSQYGYPRWFQPYLKLERTAVSISDYSNVFVMGALQTPDYAEAVFRAAHPRENSEQIKARVDARMSRLEILERAEPPLLWVIVYEGVLRGLVGSPEVMTGQCDHLLSLIQSPHVTVQVLPYKAGASASHLAFKLLNQEDGTPVLYSESRGWGHVVDSSDLVADAASVFERLRAAALSPDDSATFISEIRRDWINYDQQGK